MRSVLPIQEQNRLRFLSEREDIAWRKKWLQLRLACLQKERKAIERDMVGREQADGKPRYTNEFSCCSKFRGPPLINVTLESFRPIASNSINPVHPLSEENAPIPLAQIHCIQGEPDQTTESSESEPAEIVVPPSSPVMVQTTEIEIETETETKTATQPDIQIPTPEPPKPTKPVIDVPGWYQLEEIRDYLDNDCTSSTENVTKWVETHRNRELVEAYLRRGFESNGFTKATIPEAFKAGMRVDGDEPSCFDTYFPRPKLSVIMPDWERRIYDHPMNIADDVRVKEITELLNRCEHMCAKCETLGNVSAQDLLEDLKQLTVLKDMQVTICLDETTDESE